MKLHEGISNIIEVPFLHQPIYTQLNGGYFARCRNIYFAIVFITSLNKCKIDNYLF